MRRGQAALEYLFTYGYAFLGILVTVGVLFYFGVLDISSLRSGECTFPPGAECIDYLISNDAPFPANGAVVVSLRNNYGVNLDVKSAQATEIKNSNVGTISCDETSAGIPFTWGREEEREFQCNFTTGYYDRSFYDFRFDITFVQEGHTYRHNLTGFVAENGQ